MPVITKKYNDYLCYARIDTTNQPKIDYKHQLLKEHPMQHSLITSDHLADYGVKEFGPIILALAFVIVLGGVVAAAIIMCGRGHVKSAGISWVHRSVDIVCR